MPKLKVRFTYRVTVPDEGTKGFEDLVHDYLEDGNDPEAIEEDPENELAYYMIEKSHVGDYNSDVELVFDDIEEA